MDVSGDMLFATIGRLHMESRILQAKITELEQQLAASQAQVKLLMEQLSNKPKENP